MTQEDKYAVVVDGEVVDTVPTKRAAKEVLRDVASDDVEVREFDPEKDVVKPLPPGDQQGVPHIR